MIQVTDNSQIWDPIPKQRKFLEIPAKGFFDALYGGGLGGGKSEVLLMWPIIKGYYQHPKFHGLIARRTFPELEGTLIQRSHEFYPRVGGKYNQQKRTWHFPSGSTLEFGHIKDEASAKKYDSKEFQYIGLDELTSFTETMYKHLSGRARTSVKELVPCIRSATNPGNIGHLWVRRRFVDPAPEGGVAIRSQKTGERRMFIKSLPTDNPHLIKNDPTYLNRLADKSEAERRAAILGDWYIFEGQVFAEFRQERLHDEPENALHVYSPKDVRIPNFVPKILCVDWGYQAYTCCYWLAIMPNERVYVYREYCERHKLVSEWAPEVAALCEDENIVDIVLDPSAWQRRGEEQSLAEQFQRHSGLVARKASNDRVTGKQLLHEYLRWTPRPEKEIIGEYKEEEAERLYRVVGPEARREYEQHFMPESPDGPLPKLQISNACPKLIETLPLCVYVQKDNMEAEDVAQFKGDDPYDTIRYGVKAVQRWFRKSKDEQDEYTSRQQAYLKFQKTGDINSYIRRQKELDTPKHENRGIYLWGSDPRLAYKRSQLTRAFSRR